MRDLVKLDDWKAQIKSIQEAEHDVEEGMRHFRTEDAGAQLRDITKCLHGVRQDIQGLTAVVQNFSNDQQNLREEERDNDFLRELSGDRRDPEFRKKDIEELKGGLLKEPHELVLEHSNFEDLRHDPKTRILWVTGGPGRGKTMFLCGIIDQLLQQPQYNVVTYFLCKADDTATRTANSVMLGLLQRICEQSWGMTRHLRKKYGNKVRSLVKDENATASGALEMLNEALNRPSMQEATILIDAIDECETNSIEVLIRAIGQLSLSHRAQWIVSSRTFEKYLGSLAMTSRKFTSCLELNENVISRAVQAFVNLKVDELSKTRKYSLDLRKYVHNNLSSKASGTFLWVALVCLELGRLGVEARHVKAKLNAMPEKLNDLYKHMLDAALDTNACDHKLCGEILRLVCITSRPITLDELRALVPDLCELTNSEIRSVVANCGSFLTVHGTEFGSAALAFVHESAREYLTDEDGAQRTTFPDGIPQQHRVILGQALSSIKGLTRNNYQLPFDGIKSSDIVPPIPDPLSRLRYSCLHWLDHAVFLQRNGECQVSEDDKIESLICNDLLHWLEALGLMKMMPQGTASFQHLSNLYRSSGKPKSTRIGDLVQSANNFVRYNKACIETAPLQVYSSAILFCPQAGNDIKHHYQHELVGVALNPKEAGATRPPVIRAMQSAEIQSTYRVRNMVFSHDGRFLALYIQSFWVKDPCYLETWDVLACHRIQSVDPCLPWSARDIISLGFSHDGTKILVVHRDTSQWFQADSGRRVDKLKHDPVEGALFSPHSRFLGLWRDTYESPRVIVLEVDTGTTIQTLEYATKLAFSPDNRHLAALSISSTSVSLWRIGSDVPLWTTKTSYAAEVFFFGNNLVGVTAGVGGAISLRAINDGTEVHVLPGSRRGSLIYWLGTGLSHVTYIQAIGRRMLRVFDGTGTTCLKSYPLDDVHALAFSSATNMAVWADATAVRSWDLSTSSWADDGETESSQPSSAPKYLTFSQDISDGELLASWTKQSYTFEPDPGVAIWSLRQDKVSKLHMLHGGEPEELEFSPSGKKLMRRGSRGHLKVFDIASGSVYAELQCMSGPQQSTFSPDERFIALCSKYSGMKIWDLETQEITKKISTSDTQASFSRGGKSVAFAHRGHAEIWDMSPSGWEPHHSWDLEYEPSIMGRFPGLTLITLSPDGKSLAAATNKCVQVCSVGDPEPRCRFLWVDLKGSIRERDFSKWRSIALSPDGNYIAVAVDDQIWIWHTRQSVTSSPLRFELPHKTSIFCFDDDSTHILVDGGSVSLPPTGDAWAQGIVAFRGYRLSEDCAWIMKDDRGLLYLPPAFRPMQHPKTSPDGEVAFMHSTVAIGCESGQIFLRFPDP